MQIHQLKPKNKLLKKKRVGRGGKKGTYSGRGLKGQKSRAGRRMEPAIRSLIKKFPKLKGYRTKRQVENVAIVNIEKINFKSSEIITPELLLEKGLIRRIKGKVPKVKILGRGEITQKITIQSCDFSKSAKEKIEKAGGEIK